MGLIWIWNERKPIFDFVLGFSFLYMVYIHTHTHTQYISGHRKNTPPCVENRVWKCVRNLSLNQCYTNLNVSFAFACAFIVHPLENHVVVAVAVATVAIIAFTWDIFWTISSIQSFALVRCALTYMVMMMAKTMCGDAGIFNHFVRNAVMPTDLTFKKKNKRKTKMSVSMWLA